MLSNASFDKYARDKENRYIIVDTFIYLFIYLFNYLPGFPGVRLLFGVARRLMNAWVALGAA